MGEPDLVPSGERILSSVGHGDESDGEAVTNLVGECPVLSDRTSSVSDISTVLSKKYLTHDSCGVAQSESDYGTMDELCQMRGVDEYECRVERVPGGHQGKVLDGPAYSVRRYYRIVIVLLYVGQYYLYTFSMASNPYFQA